jgi:nitrogenase subunit NifH
VKKYAEGLSIRAAESIRSVFGYNRLATSVEQLPDGCVKLTGIFVDYAAGNITADERIVSPFYKKARSNVMERIPEDRFLNVVVKSAVPGGGSTRVTVKKGDGFVKSVRYAAKLAN